MPLSSAELVARCARLGITVDDAIEVTAGLRPWSSRWWGVIAPATVLGGGWPLWWPLMIARRGTALDLWSLYSGGVPGRVLARYAVGDLHVERFADPVAAPDGRDRIRLGTRHLWAHQAYRSQLLHWLDTASTAG